VTRPSKLPRCISISALLCFVLQSCAIDEALPVTWRFSFHCKLDAERTEVIELRVGKGGCPLNREAVFETVMASWDSPGSRPQGLPDGLYAFQGTALDADGKAIASGCESVKIPVKKAILLDLQGAARCGSIDDDLDAGAGDDGGIGVDGGVDAGGKTPDAGKEVDAGIDECPDDPAKFQMGQCPCGVPDTDTDGDGTADCLDNCDTDANKTEPGLCGCNPKTTLLANDALTVGGTTLCGPKDDSVSFGMEADGNLHLRVDTVDRWVSKPFPTPTTLGVIARMQTDGNLVIREASNLATWNSGTQVPIPAPQSVSFLSVNANGTVTISREGTVVWTRPE